MTAESLSGSARASARPNRLPGAGGRRAVTIASLVTGAVVWELVGRFVLDDIFFASFTRTLAGLAEMVADGVLVSALGESGALFLAGFAIGTTLGLVVGLVIGRVEVLAIALEDYVTLLYITPPVALVPFVLAIIGYGFWPKALVVVIFVFFPVCITTIEGVRSVDHRLLEVARSFGSTELRTWRDVVVPSAVPYAMSGIRQGIALGLVGVVAAEFLLDASGIGELLNTFSRTYRMDKLLATVLVVVVLGLLAMALGRALEARFAPWRR